MTAPNQNQPAQPDATPPARTVRSQADESVTGVQLMQGIGHKPALGFWAEAWAQVLKRPTAVASLAWITIVATLGLIAPLIASGHPLVFHKLDNQGDVSETTYPLFTHLGSADFILFVGVLIAIPWLLLPLPISRSKRVAILIVAAIQATLTVIAFQLAPVFIDADLLDNIAAPIIFAVVCAVPFLVAPTTESITSRIPSIVLVAAICATAIAFRLSTPLNKFDYRDQIASGDARATFTLIPYSPGQTSTTFTFQPPASTYYAKITARARFELAVERDPESFTITDQQLSGTTLTQPTIDAAADRFLEYRFILPVAPTAEAEALRAAFAAGELQTGADLVDLIENRPSPTFTLGTDSLRQDVLSQLLHACRLAISIGLVSTGVATVIGVTLGALMGYFGGKVDLILYRVVEIFMAVPVLFILIVAAGVLPPEMRSTYIVMAIIGLFTWHGPARFTRAEFLKLRDQDFVQSARAVGLPVRSILFKHMLPNGVTPVLVDASFAVAFAILYETILSYLNLGPVDQASWGRLLADSTNQAGTFQWWLAIFPGFAIFFTVLAYNLLGEALRDAIDPKLKKARV